MIFLCATDWFYCQCSNFFKLLRRSIQKREAKLGKVAPIPPVIFVGHGSAPWLGSTYSAGVGECKKDKRSKRSTGTICAKPQLLYPYHDRNASVALSYSERSGKRVQISSSFTFSSPASKFIFRMSEGSLQFAIHVFVNNILTLNPKLFSHACPISPKFTQQNFHRHFCPNANQTKGTFWTA
jgi:hypothetical protein